MSTKIYVGNLSWGTTNETLREEFSHYGTVLDSVVMRDRETGRSRGFGFVTYGSEMEAQSAISSMNEKDFEGRRIKVNLANARTGGGGGYGGQSGGGYSGGGGGMGGMGGGMSGMSGTYGGYSGGYNQGYPQSGYVQGGQGGYGANQGSYAGGQGGFGGSQGGYGGQGAYGPAYGNRDPNYNQGGYGAGYGAPGY